MKNRLHFLAKALQILIVGVLLFFNVSLVFARTQAEIQADIDSLNQQISNIKAQQSTIQSNLKNIQSQKDHVDDDLVYLNSQISYLESQLESLTLKVSETETQIKLTETQIEEKNGIISDLQSNIKDLEADLKLRMKDIFKLNRSNINKRLETVLFTAGENNTQSEFHKSIKKNQELILLDLEGKKSQIESEKIEIEKKQSELSTSKMDLEKQKDEMKTAQVSLQEQKNAKENMIASLNAQANKTQQSSAELTAQLNALKTRLNNYQTELFRSVNAINTGNYVKKGDVIGYEGDTGWSTGPHLHFFVSKNAGPTTNPCRYLPTNYVSNPNIGSCSGNGELGAPLANPIYTQDFNSGHDAIDITEYLGAPVYATHDGYVKRGKEQCYSWFPICKDGGANYVIICESQDCRTGFKTGYWHLK